VSRYQREYAPNEQATSSYRNLRDFPEDYEPWRINYYGNGVVIVTFLALCLCRPA